MQVYETTIVGSLGGDIPLIIHPSEHNQALIVICQGYGGTRDGFNDRYRTMAEALQARLGTVVRLQPVEQSAEDYRDTAPDSLRSVIAACRLITSPVYLAGF